MTIDNFNNLLTHKNIFERNNFKKWAAEEQQFSTTLAFFSSKQFPASPNQQDPVLAYNPRSLNREQRDETVADVELSLHVEWSLYA